jgi:LSD1 subclass zinc finger protein
MKIPCPECRKSLSVPDSALGKKVKCPICEAVFPIQQQQIVAAGSDAPLPRKVARNDLIADRPRPGRLADVDDDGVREVPQTVKFGRRSSTAAESDRVGTLYLYVGSDDVNFELGLRKKLAEFIDSEQLDLEIADGEGQPPDRLGRSDVVIDGAITDADYGSQFIRYFLTFLSLWFGVGACRLAVDMDIKDGRGRKKRVQSKASQRLGLFGGSGSGLMKLNVNVLSQRVAAEMARLLTGKSFLNHRVYQFAVAALILGLLSVIPFLGLLLAAIAVVLGVIAVVTISKRALPRRKGMAICGIIFSAVGLLFNILVIVALSLESPH